MYKKSLIGFCIWFILSLFTIQCSSEPSATEPPAPPDEVAEIEATPTEVAPPPTNTSPPVENNTDNTEANTDESATNNDTPVGFGSTGDGQLTAGSQAMVDFGGGEVYPVSIIEIDGEDALIQYDADDSQEWVYLDMLTSVDGVPANPPTSDSSAEQSTVGSQAMIDFGGGEVYAVTIIEIDGEDALVQYEVDDSQEWVPLDILTLTDGSASQPSNDTSNEGSNQVTDNNQPSGQYTYDTGFRPQVNGLSFPNYGSDLPVTNLTPAEMQRMFGDVVCAIPGDPCTLTPPASQWMEQTNASMGGGHCEGFAVLSQLIYADVVDPNQFGGDVAASFQLQNNEGLQRELAYWFATQGPTWGLQRIGTAKDQVEFLIEAYQQNPTDLYRIGVLKPDGTGGHAITAYAVEDKGNGLYWIMVYDNNYPGQERYIQVDANAGTWQYEAAINPKVEPDLYTGDDTNPMFLAANEPRLEVFACSFCGSGSASGQGGLAAEAPRFNEVWMEGDAQLLITDDEGRRLGYDQGEFVNEIPEANYQPVLGQSLAQKDVPPVYGIPFGLDFAVVIDGNSIETEDNETDVVVIGPGYYIGVEGIYMDPGQVDHLIIGGEGDTLAYRTDYSESPLIILGIETPEADFELEIQGTDIKPDTETLVVFDQQENIIALSSTSDEYGDFYVAISRIDDEGVETFESGDEPITLEPNDTVYFYFGEWSGQGSELIIGFDDGGDGNIDEIINMADEE